MRIAVGRIGRPHGVRGEVVVHVSTDDPELRFKPGSTLTPDPTGAPEAPDRPSVPGREPLTVVSSRRHAGHLIVAFAGVTDRTAAERLRGTWLMVDSTLIPPTEDPDEFYDHELIGLEVVTVDGTRVGIVTDVLHHGQDRLVVRPARPAAGEVLVPFVRQLVPEVDPRRGRLVIDPPPGLLDPDEAVEA